MSFGCTPKYFSPLKVQEFQLDSRIKKKDLMGMKKIPRHFKEDFYDHYTYEDTLNFKNRKYLMTYYLKLYDGKLKSYFFNIESNPELYYEVVKEVSKEGRFEVDTTKIKYRYYLKQKNENVYLDFKARLVPTIGVISGGKEQPKKI